MKTSRKYCVNFMLTSLILCATTGWLMSSCFLAVKKRSKVTLTIQDTTGRPLSGVGVTLTGFKANSFSVQVLETLNNVTDREGIIKLELSWPKGVNYYSILIGSSYIITDCPIQGNSPTSGGCDIRYDRDLSAAIQVKKL